MNRNQSNRYNAFQRIRQFIDRFHAILTGFTPMADEVTLFGTESGVLDGLIEEQAKNITGITEDKEALKVSMCRTTSKYGRIGAGWARKNRKNEELAILKTKFNGMFRLKDSEAIAECKNIRKVLFDNLAALVSYEILMAQITEIDDAIKNFEDFTGAPTGAIDEREQATTQIPEQFDAVDEVVATMDDLIMHWQDTEPAMLLEFKNAKEVDDIGGRLTIVEFVVTKNSNPLFDALITDSKSLKEIRTDYDGKGAIKSVRPGKRPFTINGNGQGSKEELINVIRGKTITVNVEL